MVNITSRRQLKVELYDKSKLVDTSGKPITQGLFLEAVYDIDQAIFTLKEEDYMYKGKLFYSIKKLYLDCEDVTEYEFALTYFLSWGHWQRICRNKNMSGKIDQMREELELQIRAKAIKNIIEIKPSSKSFQSIKWLSEGGWKRTSPGRPKKEETEREKNIRNNLKEEFKDDIDRMSGLH